MARSKSKPIIASPDLFSVLREFNPWWDGGRYSDLPSWRRAAFGPLMEWLRQPPAHRAVLLSGARQVGKTTLLLQAAHALLDEAIEPAQILYATFDHPFLKLVGLDRVLRVWREFQPPGKGPEYLLLDEVQSTPEWQTWVKHQTDFHRGRRLAVTGSALPIEQTDQESGVGRWHTIKIPTLSFAEYLQIRGFETPPLPRPTGLAELFRWPERQFTTTAERARPLVAQFHEYLLRGGFPQAARIENIHTAQRLLREDIVDKVLKRDMTALFGVRRVLELEKLFVYLCLHDGGILDMAAVCASLELNKRTVGSFLELLAATHLIYRLGPFGYGKEVLRARYKIYLADAAVAGSVLLRGRALLDDAARLAAAVETAVAKHLFSYYYSKGVAFSYWRGRKDLEVDLVAAVGDKLIPFEVKYSAAVLRPGDLRGLRELCSAKPVPRGYVIARELSEFGTFPLSNEQGAATIMRIPAPLACLWLSQTYAPSPEAESP